MAASGVVKDTRVITVTVRHTHSFCGGTFFTLIKTTTTTIKLLNDMTGHTVMSQINFGKYFSISETNISEERRCHSFNCHISVLFFFSIVRVAERSVCAHMCMHPSIPV